MPPRAKPMPGCEVFWKESFFRRLLVISSKEEKRDDGDGSKVTGPHGHSKAASLARQPIIRAGAVHCTLLLDQPGRDLWVLHSLLQLLVCVAESDSGFAAPQVVPFLDFFYCKG